MSSIPLLPKIDGSVFCDFLTVTVPEDEWESLRPSLEVVLEGVYCEAPDKGVYICPLGGWVKSGKRSGVVWVQASGALLAALRKMNLYAAYLQLFAGLPHRVTRLDASLDVRTDAPSEIVRVYQLATGKGGVSLTQKAVKPTAVSFYLSPSAFDGRETGTLYIGGKTAEVRLVLYDKREEFYKSSRLDLDPLLRYEFRVTGKMGASLKDAYDPTAMFWHFMPHDVLPTPAGVAAWVPFLDGGFDVDRRFPSPYERLKKRVELSRELSSLFELADDCGPQGRKLFYGLVRRFHDPGATWADVQRAVLAEAGDAVF